MLWLVIITATLASLYLYLQCRKPNGFPPGPKWWPIVGSALEVSRIRKSTGFLYKTFNVLNEKYGNVFSLKIGRDRIVVLNDYESIHSMLTNEDCDGRPIGPFYEARTWGKRRGVIVTDGPLWVEQRRFVLRHLREFGFGRTTMASFIKQEALHLIEHFETLFQTRNSEEITLGPDSKCAVDFNYNNNGQIYQLQDHQPSDKEDVKKVGVKQCQHNINDAEAVPVSKSTGLKIENMYVTPEDYAEVWKLSQSRGIVVAMNDVFAVPVLNTLWGMIAGRRYNIDDKELIYLQRLLARLLKDIDMVGCLFSHFPILRFIAPEKSGYKQFLNVHHQLRVFLNEELENHKSTFNSNQLRDLMDAYINILHTSNGESYSETQLLATCMDLFMAGSETTSKTLGTCFLYLVLYPDVQKIAQREIDTVVGKERLPTLADRSRMPYIDAIVLESLRMFMGRTISIPHRAMKDTVIAGFTIPKDTMIVANFNRLLMTEFWENPDIFRPERFINNAGMITIPKQYLPFSHGKHRCMGEGLAKSNMFLLTAMLLQRFTFSVVPGESKPLIDFIDGVTISPKPYRTLVTHRFEE